MRTLIRTTLAVLLLTSLSACIVIAPHDHRHGPGYGHGHGHHEGYGPNGGRRW